MLVLLSFGLVLVATVLLVLGLLSDDGLTLIYLSIASSVAAALVLVMALKLNKPRDQVRPTAPEPLPDLEPEPQAVPAMAAATASGARGGDEWLAADQDDWSAGDDDWQEGDEVEFPIADYDTLSSSQILPLLPQLYADEIPVVEARERSTKARPEILDRLEDLRGAAIGGEAHEDASSPALEASPAPAVAGDPLASYTEPMAGSAAWDDEDDWFPIEDYESLSAAQIRPLLPELDAEELAMVRDKESALGRRRSLLDEIDRLQSGGSAPIDDQPAAAPVRAAAAGPSSRARSTAGTSTTPSTTATKKASGTKRSAPAKKASTTAKSAGSARKASAKKAAPAKKASSARKASAPAKKASAPAKKAAAPARKAAPAKKAAAPAKKATAKNAASSKKAAPAKRSTKR